MTKRVPIGFVSQAVLHHTKLTVRTALYDITCSLLILETSLSIFYMMELMLRLQAHPCKLILLFALGAWGLLYLMFNV